MILLDTNVLLDIMRDDQEWEPWSARVIELARANDALAINPVVFTELCSQFEEMEALDLALEALQIEMAEVPTPALFLAGHAYRRYRRSGGIKAGVLPDFFIGAHAAVTGATLVTRDPARISTYFPTVSLVTPKTE